jgi:hypothetical protein
VLRVPFSPRQYVGHHGDFSAEPHDLADTIDSPGCDIVHALHSAAELRRLHQYRNLHARRPSIDADRYRPGLTPPRFKLASFLAPYGDGASMAPGTSGGLN